MGTLIVEYGKLNNFSSNARRLTRSLNDKANDLSRVAGKISSLPRSVGNADYFITKKSEQLEEKASKVDSFKGVVESFISKAKETDKKVANRIKTTTDTFRKVNNIKISVLSYLGIAMKDFAESIFGKEVIAAVGKLYRNAKYEIKDWYRNGGKELLFNIGWALVFVAAVALVVVTGGAAIVALGLAAKAALILIAVGAAVGIAAQFTIDVVNGMLTGKFEFKWQTYVGAAIGGGLGALVAPILGPIGTGVVSNFAATFTAQSLENFTGGTKRSFGQVMLNSQTDALIGGVTGKFCPNIKGINKGRGSFQAVFKSGITKLNNGTAGRMSLKVMGKGFTTNLVGNTSWITANIFKGSVEGNTNFRTTDFTKVLFQSPIFYSPTTTMINNIDFMKPEKEAVKIEFTIPKTQNIDKMQFSFN